MHLPPRRQVLATRISCTDYDEVCDLVLEAAKQRRSLLVAHAPVHLVVFASRDRRFEAVMKGFDIVAPDGQPIRWALRMLHGIRLKDRVYGPFTMMMLCSRAEGAGLSVYLYGSTPTVLERLETNLRRLYPDLQIVGREAPPFRPLTAKEDAELVKRINESRAGIVFIGLGCPKQENFAYEHRDALNAVQVCVGAAFDFVAGEKPMAPAWMQRHGLEWAFRLMSEPGRLWQRYLVTNTYFLCSLACALALRVSRGRTTCS